MTEIVEKTDRQKRVDRYLRAADVGFISLIVLVALIASGFLDFVEDSPTFVGAVLALVCLITFVGIIWSSLHLILRRGADEYIASLWNTGVTWAFITLVVYSTFVVFGFALFEAFQAEASGSQETLTDHLTEWVADVSITAFFVGFNVKRFSGGM